MGDVALIYVTATDSPFLAPGWIDRLAAAIGDADMAIPHHEGRLHPLCALYRRATIFPILQSLTDQDGVASWIWSRRVGRVVEADELRPVDPDLATLLNVNTPAEYRSALIRAGFSA